MMPMIVRTKCRMRGMESLVGAKINDISTEEWSKIIYLHFIRIGCQAVRLAYLLILHRDILNMSLALNP